MSAISRTVCIVVFSFLPAVAVCQEKARSECAGDEAASSAGKLPTVSHLLDKYAETQDKLKSFRIVTKTTINGSTNVPPATGKQRHSVRISDLRYDGNRLSIRLDQWSNMTFKKEPLPKDTDKYAYIRYLWDGNSSFSYSKDKNNKLGMLIINRDKNFFTLPRITEPIMIGIVPGTDERIDKVLRQVDKKIVREQMEKVGVFDCYVIEAKTKHASYTLWIDPARGYNIAKAKFAKKEGSSFYGRPLPKGASLSSDFKVDCFENIDEVWLPMEAIETGGSKWPGGKYSKGTFHCERTEVIMNLDHDSLGSFVLDEIPNGATTVIVGVPGKYIWKDGKILDENGSTVDLKKVRGKKQEGLRLR